MCSKPDKPKAPPPPPPPQEAKAPMGVDPKKRKDNLGGSGGFGTPGSTLLSGPSGAAAPTTGASTLLGQ